MLKCEQGNWKYYWCNRADPVFAEGSKFDTFSQGLDHLDSFSGNDQVDVLKHGRIGELLKCSPMRPCFSTCPNGAIEALNAHAVEIFEFLLYVFFAHDLNMVSQKIKQTGSNFQIVDWLHDWFMIAFITCNSNLVPLLEGLCSLNPCRSNWRPQY